MKVNETKNNSGDAGKLRKLTRKSLYGVKRFFPKLITGIDVRGLAASIHNVSIGFLGKPYEKTRRHS